MNMFLSNLQSAGKDIVINQKCKGMRFFLQGKAVLNCFIPRKLCQACE